MGEEPVEDEEFVYLELDDALEIYAASIGCTAAVRSMAGDPKTGDDDLRCYWFRLTSAGMAAWQTGSEELDSYWDARPIQDRE